MTSTWSRSKVNYVSLVYSSNITWILGMTLGSSDLCGKCLLSADYLMRPRSYFNSSQLRILIGELNLFISKVIIEGSLISTVVLSIGWLDICVSLCVFLLFILLLSWNCSFLHLHPVDWDHSFTLLCLVFCYLVKTVLCEHYPVLCSSWNVLMSSTNLRRFC